MFGASIRNQLRSAASRFIEADQGNIAVIFAIALVPILGFVGAAIDYTRANSARSSMQAALDSTALMLSKDLSEGTITTSQITTKATAYFTALYTNTRRQVGLGQRDLHRQQFAWARPSRSTAPAR